MQQPAGRADDLTSGSVLLQGFPTSLQAESAQIPQRHCVAGGMQPGVVGMGAGRGGGSWRLVRGDGSPPSRVPVERERERKGLEGGGKMGGGTGRKCGRFRPLGRLQGVEDEEVGGRTGGTEDLMGKGAFSGEGGRKRWGWRV